MAAGVLGKPGSKFGPCRACAHLDCAELVKMAATACQRCGRPIGYEVGFYQLDGRLVHARCEEEAAELVGLGRVEAEGGDQ